MAANTDQIFNGSPLFTSVFDQAESNAIQVMDKDGFILTVNKAFTNLFGYTAAELEGKHTRVLFTEEDCKAKAPEIEIETVIEKFSATDRNYIVHKNGTCIWATGESILSKNIEGEIFILKFIQSIHDQKVMEKFLRESTEFSENVVKSITDALVVIEGDYKILKANNAFYNLFNINIENVEGKSLLQLNNSFLNSDNLKEQIDQIPEKVKSFNFEQAWKQQDETRHITVKGVLLDGKMVSKKVLLLMSDVTERVQTAQQRDDLIAFVIHELRNPLNNINLINTLLEDAVEENDLPVAREYIAKSKKSVNQLNSIIQELYDATLAGSGNLRVSKSNFNFQTLFNEIIEGIQLAHPNYKIKREGDASVEINADRGRIGQVLSNYILNAIKYSSGSTNVDTTVSVDDGNVIVAVKDYGRGIEEDKIPFVFDRYFRAENTKKVEGLGLGLFLCKQIIDAHNGRAWIISKVNKGSTFYFSIPLV